MEEKKKNKKIAEQAQTAQEQLLEGKKTINNIRLEFGLQPIKSDDYISQADLLRKKQSKGELTLMDYRKVLEDQITKLEEIQDKIKTSTMHLETKCHHMCEVSKNIIALVGEVQNVKMTTKPSKEG